MTQFSFLELASREPSRLAADLAGHPRHANHPHHAVLGLRRKRRFGRHRPPTTEPATT